MDAATGTLEDYVRDIDLAPGEAHRAASPRRARLRDGFRVAVRSALTSARDSASVEVRATRTWIARPIPQAETALGVIDLPNVRVLRLRGALTVPLGRTALVGAALEGGRRLALLVRLEV